MPKPDDDFGGGLDLPASDDARFAPPASEADRPLELDPAWVAERAAKQAAWQARPKPPRQLAGVIAAVVLIAAVSAVIGYVVMRT